MIQGWTGIIFRAWVFAVAGMTAGCRASSHRDAAPVYVAQQSADGYPSVKRPMVTGLRAALGPLADNPQPRVKPMHVMAVCAGGVQNSFAAGAMVGWTASGTRPTFDVVTGGSSGALLGAYAFLGPKYDHKLEVLFTEITSEDLFDVRPVRYLLRDGALASPRPMERYLEAEINEAFLADLREAHAQGRRLFISTTNLDTKRQVIWDLGAIASSGRPDAGRMVRKILQASVTWPGLLPPVEFLIQKDGQCCREQHIDGGATGHAFIRFGPTVGWPGPGEPAPGWLAGTNLYVVTGGKLYDEPMPASKRFFGRILTGTSCLINTLARADMNQLHALSMSSGMRYHLLSQPREYKGGVQQTLLKIDSAEMRRLFDAGYRHTSAGPPWRHTPPGAEPGEEEVPRGSQADTVSR